VDSSKLNELQQLEIDLILDGGLFNGSYLVGALYFLKEMEKRNYIKINRVSSCSIGSIIGFLYFIDDLDIIQIFYNIILNHLKKNHNFNIITNLKNGVL
jgi:predicted acylesterase/phospholipase RssA